MRSRRLDLAVCIFLVILFAACTPAAAQSCLATFTPSPVRLLAGESATIKVTPDGSKVPEGAAAVAYRVNSAALAAQGITFEPEQVISSRDSGFASIEWTVRASAEAGAGMTNVDVQGELLDAGGSPAGGAMFPAAIVLAVTSSAPAQEEPTPAFDFNISVDPASVEMDAPGRHSVTVTATAINGFQGPVTVKVKKPDEGMYLVSKDCPPGGGANCMFETLTLSLGPSGSASDQVQLSPSRDARTSQVVFVGSHGTLPDKEAVVDVTIKPAIVEAEPAEAGDVGYRISVDQPTVQMQPGDVRTVTLQLERSASFTSPISLNASGTDWRLGVGSDSSGWGVGADQTTKEVTLSARQDATPGKLEIAIRANPMDKGSYELNRTDVPTVTIAVDVVASVVDVTKVHPVVVVDFVLAVTPSTVSLKPGESVEVEVSAERRNFTTPIEVVVQAGSNYTVYPGTFTLSPDGVQLVRITPGARASDGTVDFKAMTEGGEPRKANVSTRIVSEPADFSFVATPSLEMPAGHSRLIYLEVKRNQVLRGRNGDADSGIPIDIQVVGDIPGYSITKRTETFFEVAGTRGAESQATSFQLEKNQPQPPVGRGVLRLQMRARNLAPRLEREFEVVVNVTENPEFAPKKPVVLSVRFPAGSGMLRNGESGKCLTLEGQTWESHGRDDGTRLVLEPCRPRDSAQLFHFGSNGEILSKTTIGSDGHPTEAPDRCVVIKGGQANDDAPIVLWGCSNAANSNETWTLDEKNRLIGREHQKCIEVNGGATPQNAILRPCWDGANQQWNVEQQDAPSGPDAPQPIEVGGTKPKRPGVGKPGFIDPFPVSEEPDGEVPMPDLWGEEALHYQAVASLLAPDAAALNPFMEGLDASTGDEPILNSNQEAQQGAFIALHGALLRALQNPFSAALAPTEEIDLAVLEQMIDRTRSSWDSQAALYQVASLATPPVFFILPMEFAGETHRLGAAPSMKGGTPWRSYTPSEKLIQQIRLSRMAKDTQRITGPSREVLDKLNGYADNLKLDLIPLPQLKATIKGMNIAGTVATLTDVTAKAVVAFMPDQVTDLYTEINHQKRAEGSAPVEISLNEVVPMAVFIESSSPGTTLTGPIVTPQEVADWIFNAIIGNANVQKRLGTLLGGNQANASIKMKEQITKDVVERIEKIYGQVSGNPVVAKWLKSTDDTFAIAKFQNPKVNLNSRKILFMKAISTRLIDISTAGNEYTIKGIHGTEGGEAGYHFGLMKDLREELFSLGALQGIHSQRKAVVTVTDKEKDPVKCVANVNAPCGKGHCFVDCDGTCYAIGGDGSKVRCK